MQAIIQQIHDAEGHFEIAITGGGTSAISSLLGVAGASRSLLNAVIPYSDSALLQYLGIKPASSCSEFAARLLANKAFHNAQKLCSSRVLGIGATAALQTDRSRRGEDRMFVAVQSREATRVYHLALHKEDSRAHQEQQCAEFIIRIMASNVGIELNEAPSPIEEQIAPDDWQALICDSAGMTGNQVFQAIFPGAFNPPHDAHFTIRKIAEQYLGTPVAFEISAFNVDKPPLDYIDLYQRQTNLQGEPLVFTHAAKFTEKSALFPGATFVVGMDTLVRIDDAKYYGGSDTEKSAAIDGFARAQHQFLVFGRSFNGHFQQLDQAEISPALRALCLEVPESEFRHDISSSEIRGSLS